MNRVINLNLEKGDVVAVSIKGASGFYYPSVGSRPAQITADCLAMPMTGWLRHRGYSAYSVPIESVRSPMYTNVTDPYVVVWVPEKLQKKRY